MIKYADHTLAPVLSGFVERSDIFACRIACLLKSYGTGYDFADFFLQLDGSGTPTAAAAKYYSDMTVYISDACELQELCEFIGMISPASLLCPESIFRSDDRALADDYLRNDCVIMKRFLASACVTADSIISDPPLSKVWALLKSCENDGLSVPSYEDFLPDMSHKLRHGTASVRAYEKGGELAGAAMTVSQSAGCAVIGAVAVPKQFRRMGIGSACVNSLCAGLSEQGISDIFIMREPDRNEAFYTSLGFENTGNAVVLTSLRRQAAAPDFAVIDKQAETQKFRSSLFKGLQGQGTESLAGGLEDGVLQD